MEFGLTMLRAWALLAQLTLATCTTMNAFIRHMTDRKTSGYATWFTAGGAIRIALRQLWQTWKLCHYDVIDDVITRKP